MLDKNGVVRILDLGVALVTSTNLSGDQPADSDQGILGTADYIAPGGRLNGGVAGQRMTR
jgi:hypothetical protein